MADWLKSLVFGVLEGISEWLPVSSTGHLLLAERWLRPEVSPAFWSVYLYAIQLGAALAVPVLFWRKTSPFRLSGEGGGLFHRERCRLWAKIALACLPGAAAAGILSLFPGAEAALERPRVVAGALLFYGLVFLFLERLRKTPCRTERVEDLSFRDAFFIGLFQILALVPGTSRSGATILGALLLGVARPAAAQFTFFMALPVMAGMSGLKLLRSGLALASGEVLFLAVGALAAFFTSLLVIRGLVAFLRRHTFLPFGIYRLALGGAVLFFLA